MTEEILATYQHVIDDLTLVTGEKGIFDVHVDGKLIYSKAETGRKPEDGEVLAALRELIPDVRPYGT
ncbi:MAG: selenoprotein [bacterium]|nr:selenoprotein [bacterium]